MTARGAGHIVDSMSQSFTIKRVRHTGASVYIGEVDGRDTWTRNPEAIVNWLCDGWRTRFNQLRSCRQKTVWVDGVEARHPDGTKVLAPLGETVTDITVKQAREQFPHLAGLPSLVLESPTRIENTEWWTAVKRRRTLANKGVPAGAMPRFKSRKAEQRFVMWFNNGKGYEVHRTGRKSGVVVVRGMVPKEHLRPGETSRYWRLDIHFRMSADALTSTSMQVDWMHKRLTLVSPVPERKAPLTGAMVGLDVGVAHAVTTSDGTHLDLPDTSAILAKRKMHQRAMARSKARAEAEGREFWRSRRYREHKRLAAKHAQHLANVRREFAHQTSNALVRDHDLIVMEKLRVRDMTRKGRGKRGLNRSILESAWSMTRSMIEYKAGVTPGKTVVLVDPRHTSQRCRKCGHIAPENRESQAVFECTSCGHMAHADINAAGNILDRHFLGWTSPAAKERKTKKSEAPMASPSDLRTPALAP